MGADQGMVDAVATENVKVVAGGPAGFYSTLPQVHVGHLAALAQIREAALGSFVALMNASTGAMVKTLVQLDPLEALGNAVVGQQGAKVGQSTPPETGK